MEDDYDVLMGRLTRLIKAHAKSAASEQNHPGGGADESDEGIATDLKKLRGLRRVRGELEELLTGVIVREG